MSVASAIGDVALYCLVIILIGKSSGALSQIASSMVSGTDAFSRHRGAGAAGAAMLGAGAAKSAGRTAGRATKGVTKGAAHAGSRGAAKAVNGLANRATGHTKATLKAAVARRREQFRTRGERDQAEKAVMADLMAPKPDKAHRAEYEANLAKHEAALDAATKKAADTKWGQQHLHYGLRPPKSAPKGPRRK